MLSAGSQAKPFTCLLLGIASGPPRLAACTTSHVSSPQSLTLTAPDHGTPFLSPPGHAQTKRPRSHKMRRKTTTKSLAILELGSPRANGQQMFVLASCHADGSCVRSYETSWASMKYRRLPGWLRQCSQDARTHEGLSELLQEASRALRHGNATHAGRRRAASARAVGRARQLQLGVQRV